MTRIATILLATIACAATGVSAADSVPTNNAAANTENGWGIELQGFCSGGKKPFFIYARESNGRWLSTVVSSQGKFNKVWHAIDLSGMPIKDGKMKGAATMTILPDEWGFPVYPFPMTVEIDATSPSQGRLEGSWKITEMASADDFSRNALTAKEGKLVGTAKSGPPATIPTKVTFKMNMTGLLTGSDPKYTEALSLAIGCENGKAVCANWARLGERGARTSITPFQVDADAVRHDAYSLHGKCSFTGRNLDGDGTSYVVELDGYILGGNVTGVYKARIAAAGKSPIEKQGGFEGKCNEGIEKVAIDTRPWWNAVKDFKEVQTAEHPRLLFRKSDLPMLRKRAETPEGKAILARLRLTLDGKNGDTMPVAYNPEVGPVDHDGAGDFPSKAPMGSFTVGHVAGYGLLYQLTGDKKYADLGRQCFEKSMEGYRDVDCRYSFQGPQNPFRGGTALAWMSAGFDLCYDGWDPATRSKVAKAIAEYKGILSTKGNSVSLDDIVRGDMPPFSNHFGAQVGGGAMALLAVLKEPDIEQSRINKLLATSEHSMMRNLCEGFGDGGFFAEGDGTGSISSQLSFLPALQAWRSVLGRDYINVERPNARMLTLKWIYLTIVRNGSPDFWPIRGAYGHNVWARGDKSGAGYFAEGIACVTDEQKAAMKWYYNRFLLATDTSNGGPYDTISRYPHLSVCSFVNWPFDMPERNPSEVLPLCYRDSLKDFYAWRNRWQDGNDIVISTLLRQSEGFMKARADGSLAIAAFGKKDDWAKVGGGTKFWWMSPRGHASVLTVDDGTTTGIDFTKSSGVDALLVTTKVAKEHKVDQEVKLGNTILYFRFLTADATKPTVTVEGDKAMVGKQTVTLKDGNICFGVTAP